MEPKTLVQQRDEALSQMRVEETVSYAGGYILILLIAVVGWICSL